MKAWFPVALLALAACGCGQNKDPRQVLEQNADAMFALPALRVQCRTTLTYDGTSDKMYEFAVLTAQKPLLMRYDAWRSKNPLEAAPETAPEETFASNGTVMYKQFGHRYLKEPHVTAQSMFTLLEPWKGFYAKKNSIIGQLDTGKVDEGGSFDLTYAGQEKVNGILCDKVQCHKVDEYQGTQLESRITYYISAQDHLVRRALEHITFDGKRGYTSDAYLQNIETHPQIDPAVFAYVPPKSAKILISKPSEPLLANGKVAPDFRATDMDGKEIKLSDFRGKVVVLDFWASWCGPCRESMPHTQDVASKLAAQGQTVFLAVDDGEPESNFNKWVAANRSQFQNLRFAHATDVSSKLYKVSGIPTQFVIDRGGVVRASFVGYGGPTDDLANAIQSATH